MLNREIRLGINCKENYLGKEHINYQSVVGGDGEYWKARMWSNYLNTVFRFQQAIPTAILLSGVPAKLAGASEKNARCHKLLLLLFLIDIFPGKRDIEKKKVMNLTFTL